MAESILDKHEYQDGRIVLYRRGDISDNSNYTARLRVPKASGYVIRSTGTSDLFEARKYAEDLYDQLRLKVMNGESLRDNPFDKCIEDYKKELGTQTFKTEKERKEVKVSTPETKCIGTPETKCISEASRKAPRGGPSCVSRSGLGGVGRVVVGGGVARAPFALF